MLVTADIFTIRMTPAEFLYAASIAGFEKLYLFDWLAPIATKSTKTIGRESLEARGLCHSKKPNEVVMESTLYAIVRWALLPSWVVQFVVDTLYHSSQVSVFSQNGLMLVRKVDDCLEFQIDRQENHLKECAFSYVGIHSQVEPTHLPTQNEIELSCQINFYRYVNSCPYVQGRKIIVGNSKSLWLNQINSPEVNKYIPISAKSVKNMGIL